MGGGIKRCNGGELIGHRSSLLRAGVGGGSYEDWGGRKLGNGSLNNDRFFRGRSLELSVLRFCMLSPDHYLLTCLLLACYAPAVMLASVPVFRGGSGALGAVHE